jgi:hypothetical protein
MVPQLAPSNEEQPPAIAQMIAAVCDALRESGSPRGEVRWPAGAVADRLKLRARLRRIRTRLDWIDAQVRALEAELAGLKRIARQNASAAAENEGSRRPGMTR